MKLFECTNGYTGSSYTRVYVIAEDVATATQLASEALKRDSDEFAKIDREGYETDYWENIRVQEMCPDTSVQYVSGVMS